MHRLGGKLWSYLFCKKMRRREMNFIYFLHYMRCDKKGDDSKTKGKDIA